VLASLVDVPEHRWPVRKPFRLDDCSWVSNRWCELLPLTKPQKHHLLMLDNPLIPLELMHDLLDEHGADHLLIHLQKSAVARAFFLLSAMR
jgi:Lon protease-like protein